MNDNHGTGATGHAAPPSTPLPATTALPILAHPPMAGAVRPEGVALDFADGTFVIEIRAGGAPSMALGSYEDEDVVAVWRRLAADSGLPLLLPGPDGALQQVYPQIGRMLLGRHSDRRRLTVLSGRRPRFLANRRATAMPRRPRIHREVEIACGLAR